MNIKKDKIRFAQVMAAVSEVFDVGHEASALKTEIYFKALERFNMEDVEQAASRIIQTRTTATFPKPADFIQSIRGTNEEIAIQAWALVDKAMRKEGNYISIDFGDKKIHQCIEMLGGWEHLGTLTEDEWKWKHKEFKTLYQSLQDDIGPEYVIGIDEKYNNAHGYKVKPPLKLAIGRGTKLLK